MMAIEAPFSKYRKNNLKIYIVFCVVGAIVFGYDGYLSKYEWSHRRSFYEKHVKEGKPDDKMIFNQWAPVFLGAAAIAFAVKLLAVKNKKLLADEEKLIISNKEKISYDAIEKVDKTYFDAKGYFIITYREPAGSEIQMKISDKQYDNLGAILEHLVAKIS
jgi:hypothetical protein